MNLHNTICICIQN